MDTELVRVLDYHLEHLDLERCGFGPDEYSPEEPFDHPMAYALYARGLTVLFHLTAEDRYLDMAVRVADRLLALRGERTGWGLPFAYRDLPAGHPYAVTTAIAAQALAAVSGAGAPAPDRDLALREACDWLAHGIEWEENPRSAAPWYAPGFPLIAVNVAAHVAAALVQGGAALGTTAWTERANQALRHVRDGQHEAGFWTYAEQAEMTLGSEFPPTSIVDSVHTAYTVDGLVGAAFAADGAPSPVPGAHEAAQAGVLFLMRFLRTSDGRLRERIVIADEHDERTARLLSRKTPPRRYLPGGRWLIEFPKEARLWSYGAVVGGLARAAEVGCCRMDHAAAFAGRMMQLRLDSPDGRMAYREDDRRALPRHEAHVFEGLAAFAWAANASAGLQRQGRRVAGGAASIGTVAQGPTRGRE